jgi:hypothetical protein
MKMKKLVRFFAVAAIIAAGFTGCSEETPVPTPDPNGGSDKPAVVEAGLPTYATFTFKVSEGSTKAPVLDTYESAGVTTGFYDVRLLVFDYKADSTGICEANELIESTTPVTILSKTVLVRSGQKLLLVIANASKKTGAIADSLKTVAEGGTIRVSTDPTAPDNTATTFKQFMDSNNKIDLGTGTGTNPVTDVAFGKLVITATPATETNSMIFSNGTGNSEALRTLVANVSEEDSRGTSPYGEDLDHNHFVIDLQRTVGKAIAYYQAAAGTTVTTGDLAGTLSDLKYGLQNVNRSVKLFQSRAVSSPYKPIAPYYNLWDATTQLQAEADSGIIFVPYYYRTYDSTQVTQPLTFTTSFTPATPPGPSIYATENATNRTFNGAKTYFVIRGHYTPKPTTVFITGLTDYNKLTGDFTLATTTSYTAGTSFWRLHDLFIGEPSVTELAVSSGGVTKTIPKETLFLGGAGDTTAIKKVAYIILHGSDSTGFGAANTTTFLLKDLGENLQFYKNALCFYRLNIRQSGTNNLADNNEYVLRNNWYQAAITSFTGLGSPTLKDLDDGSGTEDTTPTYVTAEFNVLPWVDAASVTDVTPWEP